MRGIPRLQHESGACNRADAAPVSVHHRENVIEQAPRQGIAARFDGHAVAVFQSGPTIQGLPQYGIGCLQQAFGCEAGYGRWEAVAFRDKTPFFRTHDGGDMAWSNQGVQSGIGGFQ